MLKVLPDIQDFSFPEEYTEHSNATSQLQNKLGDLQYRL